MKKLLSVVNIMLGVLLSILVIGSASSYNQTNYSSNGNYIVPNGTVSIYVQVWGAGGGGGDIIGSGGGGGGFASSVLYGVSSGTNFSIIVGSGGAGGTGGSAGGGGLFSSFYNSSFVVNASGGGGGGRIASGGISGAGGGSGINGTFVLTSGGSGGTGYINAGGGGGGGAGSFYNGFTAVLTVAGSGGLLLGGNGGNGGNSASNGNIPAGGGGGAGGAGDGGTGGNGAVIVTNFNSSDSYGFLKILIYDENNLSLITPTNITLDLTNTTGDITSYSTTSGSLIFDLLPSGSYKLKFYQTTGVGYVLRQYNIAISNVTVINLDAYLSTSTVTTLFTIKDSGNSNAVENAIVTMSRNFNGSLVTVTNTLSDVTGSVQFNYIPYKLYRFTISKTGYTSMIFYLDPILLSSYTINLVPSSTASLNYDNVGIVINPTSFYNYRQNNLTFSISSPDGVLSNYGITAYYPSGNVTNSGVNANGGILQVNFNTSASTGVFDTVNLTYFFTSVDTGYHEFNRTYSIRGSSSVAMGTFFRNQAERFGFGDFEAVLIATIFILLVAGAATYFGGSLIGGTIGLFMMAYFFYIGLLPLWSIVMSMLGGFVFITWRSTQ